MLSNATLDGPFVGVTGSSSDYAIRGTVGLDYELTSNRNVGAFWKSRSGYTFENLFAVPLAPPGTFADIAADRPQILGLGIANSRLMDGCLLLAFDAVSYVGGLVYRGLLHQRDEDVVGAGIAWAELFQGRTNQETVVEFFYKAQMTPHISLQPDLQYIAPPSGIHPDSLAAGVRFQVNL